MQIHFNIKHIVRRLITVRPLIAPYDEWLVLLNNYANTKTSNQLTYDLFTYFIYKL